MICGRKEGLRGSKQKSYWRNDNFEKQNRKVLISKRLEIVVLRRGFGYFRVSTN